MSRIAEEHLMRVKAGPFGAHPSGDKPTERRGKPLDYDQTDPSADREGGSGDPAFGQADTVVGPRPAPSDVRTTANATAATAPAKIAAQLTAEVADSLPTTRDGTLTGGSVTAMINARSKRGGL
jgi:hypothetical protein